jgi:hypothetical protein
VGALKVTAGVLTLLFLVARPAAAVTYVFSTPIAGDSVPTTLTLDDAPGGNAVDVTEFLIYMPFAYFGGGELEVPTGARVTFDHRKVPIKLAFGVRDTASAAQIVGERREHALERPVLAPLLVAPVARLVRRVARRQVLPRGAGLQHPQHALEHAARVAAGPASPHRALRLGDQRRDDLPLGFGEAHSNTHTYATWSDQSIGAGRGPSTIFASGRGLSATARR